MPSIIGDVMNNSFARARQAWTDRDIEGYQRLTQIQTDHGAAALNVNLDGTAKLRVKLDDMLAFLPELVPALQSVTDLPLCFDNPDPRFHEVALASYDATKAGPPIINSVAASRNNLDHFYDLIASYDATVIVMASERFVDGASAQCTKSGHVLDSALYFADTLADRAGRDNTHLIIDPGLAPVAADTYGLVNMGLDAMQLIFHHPDLAGAHMSVGLTNFAFGVPREIRRRMECAYLTMAVSRGLDFVLASVEKKLELLDESDEALVVVRRALERGRPKDGETTEDAGFRQSETIMELF